MSRQRREIVNTNKRTSSPSTSHTLPSPTSQVSVSQSESTALSRSPEETTAYRPRTPIRNRYPESLGAGHVPLHRRGTSQTYERLEDLLREAGYKETRIFTPESERTDAQAARIAKRDLGGVNINGRVVGFLTGLIPGALSRSSSLQQPENVEATYSPPASPLANKKHLDSPVRAIPHMHQLPHNGSSAHAPDPTSRPPPRLSGQTQSYAQASQARAYLRHMSSVPNMPRRLLSSSSPRAHGQLRGVGSQSQLRNQAGPSSICYRDGTITSDDGMFGGKGNGEGEVDRPPPLPRTWLESVARAVLGGGKGAYVGGPQSLSAPGPPPCAPSPNNSEYKYATQSQVPSRAHSPIRRQGKGRSESVDPSVASDSGFASNAALRPPVLRHATSSLSQSTLAAHNKAHSRRNERALLTSSDHRRAGLDRMRSSQSLRPPPSHPISIPSPRKPGGPPHRMRISRAAASEGAVSCARVVCRSTPASRANSPGASGGARSRPFLRSKTDITGASDLLLGLGYPMDSTSKGKGKGKAVERGRQMTRKLNKNAAASDGMPSLASTHTKGDVWTQVQREARRDKSRGVKETHAQRIARRGADVDELSSSDDEEGGGSGDEDENNSSSDEEGAVRMDLARLLVHPKRQNSIISLRRHLQSSHVARGPLHSRYGSDPMETDEEGTTEQDAWGERPRRPVVESGW